MTPFADAEGERSVHPARSRASRGSSGGGQQYANHRHIAGYLCFSYAVPMAMHKQMVSLTAPQMAFLREEAARLGISVSDVIRRILDQHRDASTAPTKKETA